MRVANLGISNFLVTAIHVRTQDLAEFHYSVHQVVESGKSEEISLPREACADHPLSVDLEITLEFVGLDIRGKTEPKCFNVSMALDDIPNNGLWGIRCPRCNLGGMLFMSMKNNMKTFADPAAICLPGGVWGGWGVSEAMEGFVTSLAGGNVAWSMTPPWRCDL